MKPTRNRRSNAGTSVALCALLVGCAAPPMMPLATGVTAVQPRPGAVVPPTSGVSRAVVRSFAAAEGTLREVAGARCNLEGGVLGASFVTPSHLEVPNFGAQAPALRVACTDGVRSGVAVGLPQTRQSNGVGGWPAVGISVGTGGNTGVSVGGWWAGGWGLDNPEAAKAVYPEIRVVLDERR